MPIDDGLQSSFVAIFQHSLNEFTIGAFSKSFSHHASRQPTQVLSKHWSGHTSSLALTIRLSE
jgi:hypothetical protein